MRTLSSLGLPALFLGLAIASLPAFSKGIEPSHQSCKADEDCSIITIGCACIHNSTCADPEDQKNGTLVGLNKAFAAHYADLSKCSAAETRQCSTAGAC